MKKNFMAIASLLIAAMLLVVSCAPEANVEGKVEDGLVEAVIGLGRSAKDITIANKDNAVAHITYKYSLQPAWGPNDTGAPIYGAVSDEEDKMKVIDGSFGIAASVPNTISLGKVTPGLWNIHVIGYNNGKKVLEGKASKYFNGTDGEKAIVFVAPVSTTEEVNVKITLRMQNLGDNAKNQIKYSFTNLNDTYSKVTDTIDNPTENAGQPNVLVYEVSNVKVKSGFNTVTFSLPGYEVNKEDGTKEVSKGGITKTFLAIPGVDVTIDGSVTPAEFKEGNADIKVLSIAGGRIELTANEGSPDIYTHSETIGQDSVVINEIVKGKPYTFTYSPLGNTPEIADAIDNTIGGYNMNRTYQWYVGSVSVEGSSSSETAAKFVFNESNLGDYNVTCVETITFTKGTGENAVTHKLLASTTFEVVRVLEATTQNQ